MHPGKCFLGMESGVLLGHVVSRKGLEVDSDKIKAILALLAPTTVREVRGFLGCIGYYRRFIVCYAKVATPLKEFLKRETDFVWTDRRQQAFEELKKALTTASILSPPEWEREFHITLDASEWCMGAILWQYQEDRRENPILLRQPAKRKYTTIDSVGGSGMTLLCECRAESGEQKCGERRAVSGNDVKIVNFLN